MTVYVVRDYDTNVYVGANALTASYHVRGCNGTEVWVDGVYKCTLSYKQLLAIHEGEVPPQ